MLTVENLTKLYANTTDSIVGGIRDTTFGLEPGTFFTLLGPSGCGKTTTLRCIAGLESPDCGVIKLGDRVQFDSEAKIQVPMNKRKIGMVFQSYAIWPHMTVFDNVAFPLDVAKDKKFSAKEKRDRVTKVLTSVGLEGYQNRPAPHLSGGEQQRVALARALVRDPEILLLDEPLSNLDAHTREEMRAELKRLQQQTGITTLYVTHDQTEALSLSDRIAVLEKGRIAQIDTPEALYFRPKAAFVASFIGTTNLLEGSNEIECNKASDITAVKLGTGKSIRCRSTTPIRAGARTLVSIRPENIVITKADSKAMRSDHDNIFEGQITQISFQGPTRRFNVQIQQRQIQVWAPPDVYFDIGETVRLSISTTNAIAVARDELASDTNAHLPPEGPNSEDHKQSGLPDQAQTQESATSSSVCGGSKTF